MSQHNTLTLEPCPFCGAQPEQCDVGDHVVTCPSCGVDGPYGAPSGVAGAIQGWNRRAALSATQPAAGADVLLAIATVRESYRGTDWGKVAECICDAIDAAIAASGRQE